MVRLRQEGVEDIQMNFLKEKKHIKNHRIKNDRGTYLAMSWRNFPLVVPQVI